MGRSDFPSTFQQRNHMTRRDILLRSWLLAGVSALLMAFGVSNAQAQNVLSCKCDVGTIYVGKVDCKFEVCIKDAAGFQCITVAGGSVEQFKCHDEAVIYLKDCNGNLIQINNDKTNCVECICVGRGCCVDACVGYDEKGCIYVKISPSICRGC